MILALIGNQNTGKTLLFNQLTGSNQHTGNFPGVTVDRRSGGVKEQKDITIVDLPGIYSLSPYSMEEIVTRDFILKDKPEGIINIVDVSNIERNLYLTLQLLELGIPTVLALNMMDELQNNGGSVNVDKLSKGLGIPIVPISALKNQGLSELVSVATQMVETKSIPKKIDFCEGAIHRCIHGISHLIEDHADRAEMPRRFVATKLIEGDEIVSKALALSTNEKDMIEHGIVEMESELKTDREAALADMRYNFIEKLSKSAVKKPTESKEGIRSIKVDALLTHKYLGIPIFLGIMMTIFTLSFGVIGEFLTGLLVMGIDAVTESVESLLEASNINEVVQDLVINGIFAGVGGVLEFLPIIITLFFFLSLLEDSGYMARVAFVMDRPLRALGLSGKSFVPMIIGFGCSVPAVMATRTIASDRDRKLTIVLIPFMSCTAKLPIYAVFSAAFFPNHAALAMIILYLTGILLAIICGMLLNDSVFKGTSVPFVMEMPNYRLPSIKSVVLLLWEKAKDFLTRAFTIIFVASMVIWFLQTFDYKFDMVDDTSNSMLAAIGSSISFIFAPLGFGNWQSATAVVTGFIAKEAVVTTLAVLADTTEENLTVALGSMFSTLSAASFLVFTLLYVPCAAAVASIRRELGGRRTLYVVCFQLGVAWITAFLVYQIGSVFF